MPNGGEDCCGTCPYNTKNKGVGGYSHAQDREPDFCKIRQLPIEFPFYTYCANHPFRNAEQTEIPIGPVFISESLPPRWVWKESPDNEIIRKTLLKMLGDIRATPPDEYPMGLQRWEIVIWQLGEFRETRAVAHLQRLAGPSPRGKAESAVAVHALEALHKVEGHPDGDSCPTAGRFIRSRRAAVIGAERAAEAVRVAQAVLDGNLGVIEGSLALAGVASLLSADEPGLMPTFVQVVIASQSYPLGPSRANWNAEALKTKDLERRHYEDEVAGRVKDACRAVVRLLAASTPPAAPDAEH